MLIARVQVFRRYDSEQTEEVGYPPSPGDTQGANGQAVHTARRVLDACPEIDRVDVSVLSAGGTPIEIDGQKRLRAGVVRRPVEVARNVAFQAAVAEMLGAENWTRRLRQQATIAAELIELMTELPRRLEERDNTGRRRAWCDRTANAVIEVVNLPARPLDRRAVLGVAQSSSLARLASEDDDDLRKPDKAATCLAKLAGALNQLAKTLGEPGQAFRGAGAQLGDIPKEAQEARAEGAPVFEGVGDTLPPDLDDLANLNARLLTSWGEPGVARGVNLAKGDRGELERVLTTAAETASKSDAAALKTYFGDLQLDLDARILADPAPLEAWRTVRVVATCDVSEWDQAAAHLQSWGGDARREAGLRGRITLVATYEGEVLPLGLQFYGTGDILPLPEDGVDQVAAQLGTQRPRDFQTRMTPFINDLIGSSYAEVRKRRRDQSWPAVTLPQTSPTDVATAARAALGPTLQGAPSSRRGEVERSAVQGLLELCDVVRDEDPIDGLAAQVAAIDIRTLATPLSGRSLSMMTEVQALALEADRATE